MPRMLDRAYWEDYVTFSQRRTEAATVEKLRHDFCQCLGDHLLADRLEVRRPTAQAIAASLFQRMSDPTLSYHTPLHVLSMLAFAQHHGIELPLWQELAVWFHDAIYEPAVDTGENEHNSALFMRSLLHSYVSEEEVLRDAEQAIEATSLHQQADVDPAFELVLDLDFCSFAWNRPSYEEAGRNIAAEFVPVYGQEYFQVGRLNFLTQMLAKGFVYRTVAFHPFEAKARQNIEPDVAALSVQLRTGQPFHI